jgi:hypothetical protein
MSESLNDKLEKEDTLLELKRFAVKWLDITGHRHFEIISDISANKIRNKLNRQKARKISVKKFD